LAKTSHTVSDQGELCGEFEFKELGCRAKPGGSGGRQHERDIAGLKQRIDGLP
jgi:hypothetical protein